MKSIRFALAAALLAAAARPAHAQNDPCRDPWVSRAVKEVKGRPAVGQGEMGECNIKLYGAAWSSYDDLKAKVQQTFRALDATFLVFEDNGRFLQDDKFHVRFFEGNQGEKLRVGPKGAYTDGNWYIDLPNGYQLVMNRKCPQKQAANTVCY